MTVKHEEFIRDVRFHEMEIYTDTAEFRTLLFRNPLTSNQHYYITTWPGYLCISGDMGTYTFFRSCDMFTFFRDDRMTGWINPQYWHEKCVSFDRSCAAEELDAEKFKERVFEDAGEWQVRLADADHIKEELNRLCQDSCASIDEANREVYEFESRYGGNTFYDFDAPKKFSYHFVWCLRAIVWSIKQYDLVKQGRTQADHDRLVLSGEK